MNNEQYKYNSLKEFGITEEELVQFVRETLDELQIPYTNTPGSFVFGESMFNMLNEDTSLRIKTVVREAMFIKEYNFVSIANTPRSIWNVNSPICDYSSVTIPAA